MSITVLPNTYLPNMLVAAGVTGRRVRQNQRTQNGGGFASVNRGWVRSRREFSWGSVALNLTQMQAMTGLFEATDAGTFGFLMEDPTDRDIAADQGVLYPYQSAQPAGTIGLGYGVPTYQLYKRYPIAGSVATREAKIGRPKQSPVPALLRAGVAVVLGASAGNAAINYDTGVVTFVADVSKAVTGRTLAASTQITFGTAFPGIAVGGRLFLSGMTGIDAALLNDKSHAVTAIVGSTYTVSTDTAGKAINISGTGSQFPQPTEPLTWSGQAWVPVHFAEDELEWEVLRGGPAGTRLFSCPNITLVEVRE